MSVRWFQSDQFICLNTLHYIRHSFLFQFCSITAMHMQNQYDFSKLTFYANAPRNETSWACNLDIFNFALMSTFLFTLYRLLFETLRLRVHCNEIQELKIVMICQQLSLGLFIYYRCLVTLEKLSAFIPQ